MTRLSGSCLCRTLPLPQRHRQPAALPQQPHPLLQLHHALPVRRGQHRGHPGADHQVSSAGVPASRTLWAGPQPLNRVFQGSAGEADREPAAPLGSPHHLHRADQEPRLQVLEPRLCSLCPGDREVCWVGGGVRTGGVCRTFMSSLLCQAVPVGSPVLHGPEAGPAGDGGHRSQLVWAGAPAPLEDQQPDMRTD